MKIKATVVPLALLSECGSFFAKTAPWKPTAGEMSTTQLAVSSSADDHLQTRGCQLVNISTTVTPENFSPLSHYDITGRHYMAADNTTPTESDDDPKENTNIPRNQASKVPKPMGKTNNRNNTGHRNPLKQKQSSNQFNLRQSDEEATPENSPSKPFPSSESRSHSDPNPKAIDEGSNYDPHSLEGTSVLWQILFQLKGTAASSQGQNNPPSSPAQSRITEVGWNKAYKSFEGGWVVC